MVSRSLIARNLMVPLAALLMVITSACGPDNLEAPATQAEAAPPDDAALEVTSQEQSQCQFYNYYWDEARNPRGPNRCTNSCQCDGMRTCSSSGWCQGTARPGVSCTSPNYYWNEAWNPGGSNRCWSACQCDGMRTCSSSGWCQGRSR
ncbi:hypothetical protein ACN47A_22620 [Myxococcus fulvus]|uniref:hypothetical protein n=1 Tax=Myxococcus fulvus TaxID=33 RepID=UPI003B99CF19